MKKKGWSSDKSFLSTSGKGRPPSQATPSAAHESARNSHDKGFKGGLKKPVQLGGFMPVKKEMEERRKIWSVTPDA